MALLIIEQNGKRQAGSLTGRVLIGRWPDNSIVIDDQAVSRIHAWVGVERGRYYIADAGSRTGTLVNGNPLAQRHVLHNGDQIGIGPAVLTYRTHGVDGSDLTEIDLSPRTPDELSGKHGVFMDCVCGAPLWLPSQFAGVGQCRYCGHVVTQGSAAAPAPVEQGPDNIVDAWESESLPSAVKEAAADDDEMNNAMTKILLPTRPIPAGRNAPPPAPVARPTSRQPGPFVPQIAPIRPATTPLPPPPASPRKLRAEKDQVCGICRSAMSVFEELAKCPSCGLEFHSDCWHENHGCSAYGCPQVNAVGNSQ